MARRRLAIGWAFALLLAWLLNLVVVQPVAAQTEVTPSTPCLTSTNLTNLSVGAARGITNQPVISADGSRVTFWSVNNLGGGNVDGNIEVFVRETGGNNSIVQLTNSVGSILGGFNLEPSINTVGTHIAFYSDRDLVEGQNQDGNFEIFLARRAGNGSWSITQVTDTEGSANLFPSINAAGNRIAFVSDDSELHNVDTSRVNAERNFEIFSATIPNSGAVQFRQVTNTGAGVTNDQPVINASGSRIAFTAATGQTAQVLVWDESNSTPTQLTQTDTNDQPSISGDGTSIVYIATTTDDRSRVVLHTLSADGSESRAEVIVPATTNTKYRSPSISGNGERVVYVAEQDTGAAVQINVLLYDINTRLGVPISEVGGGTGEQPAISSDGTRVTFVGVKAVGGSTDDAGSDIYLNECPQADLALAFVNPPIAAVLAGVDIEYLFRITNKGPSVAEDAFFRSDLDVLPGLPANVNRLLPSGCSIDANNILVCPLGDIAVNASRTFTMGYDIPSNAGLGNIVSQIEVGANVVDSRPDDNDTGQFTTGIFEESALSLAVTTDRSSILAGSPEQLTYDLVVTNAGPSQARSARITDTLPTGSTFVSVQLVQGGGAGANCPTPSGNVVVCQLNNLTSGSTTIVRIKVTANASAPATLTNVATVRSLTLESNLANNTVTTQTAVERAADMSITKRATPTSTVIAGREITYTITFTNNGFADTLNPTVIDSLPQNVTYVRSTLPTGATCTASGGGEIATCNFPGTLLVGQSVTFDLVALVGSIVPAGPITNTARILSGRTDPNPVNDVTPPVQNEVTLLSDLTVAKSVNNETPDVFETITYTVKVRNDGPSQAYSVVVTDMLPSEMTFVTYTATAGSYDEGAGLWTIGTLPVRPVGQETTLTLVAFATSGAGGDTKVNTATVGGSAPEPAGGLPSTASATIKPQLANVRVLKTSLPAPATKVIAGQRLTYTLAVRNLGPTLARSVLLTDVLPANVFLVSVSAPVGSCTTGPTITCPVGDMTVNQELLYTVVVTRSLKGVITNTVSVSSLTPDIVLGNNAASHSITVDPDLPHHLTFTQQPPAAVTAGAIFSPSPLVEIRDRFNNLINNTTGFNDPIKLLPFVDPSCTTAVTLPLALSNGQVGASGGVATFSLLTYTRAETIYLKAEDTARTNVTACSSIVAVSPDTAKKLVITTPPRSLIAGKKSAAITVERQDQFDNPTKVGSFVVSLADSSATGSFLNASNATIANVTIANNTSNASFFYTDTVIGTYAITVTGGSGVTSYSQPITVTAAPASKLLIVISAPLNVVAGEKSGLITIARVDEFGNENDTDPTVTAVLDSDSAVADQFYKSPVLDNTVITTITIPVGQSRASFRYRNTLAEEHRIFITDQNPSGLAGAFTDILVIPAATDHLVFTTAARTVTAGQLSATITVAREDIFFNRNSSDADLSVVLASTSTGTKAFTPSSPVTILQGSDHVDFQYSDTLAGIFTLTASSGALGSDTQQVTVVPAAANKVRAETAANGSGTVVATQNVTAGQTRQLFAITRDAFDNFVGNPSATWTITVTGGVLGSDISPTTGASTTFTARKVGTAVIQPNISGLAPVASGTLTVVIGAATKVRAETAANGSGTVVATQNVTAGQTRQIFAITRDAFDNFVGNPSATWTITVTGGVLGSDISPTTGASTTFTARKLGTAVIQPNISGLAPVASGTLTVISGTATKVRAETLANGSGTVVPTQNVTAGLTSELFAITRDAFDNFVGNPVTATWTIAVSGGVTTTDITPTTGASTTFTARKLGTGVVQPSVSGLVSVPSGTLTVVAGNATKVRVESAANGSGTLIASRNITAGDTLTVYAITRDAFNNFVDNPSATWTITRTGNVSNTDISLTTGSSTTFTARKVGTGIIHAAFNALPPTPTGVLTVVVGPVTKVRAETLADGSGTVVATQSVVAGQTRELFAITRDAFDNFIGNPVTATWTIAVSGGVTTTDISPTTGASTTFTARKLGTGVVQSSVTGLASVPSGTLTVVAGTATKVRIESANDGSGTLIASQNITAGNTLTVFAIRRDAFDNFVNNPSATWTFTPTGGVLSSDLTPTTGASTTFTARKVGTGTFRANVSGPSLASPNVTLTVVAGNATKVRVESAANGSGTLIASQIITAGNTLTVYAITRDTFDNFVGNPSATWTITRTGNVSTTDISPMTGSSTTFTARKVGTGILHASFNALAPTPTGVLTVVVGPVTKVRAETAANGSGTVVPTQSLAAGQTRDIFAITRDAFDNFVGNPVTATWTITVTGGVTTTDITPTTGASTTFTARKLGTGIVQPSVSGLASVPSGTLTVVAGNATKVRVESAANGSGTLIASQIITAGNTLTVFAITRDAFDNFVGNPSATWTITRTGNVSNTDISPTTGSSTTFTARKVGTGIIHAAFNALPPTPTGVLTVVVGPVTKVRAETLADGNGTVVPTQDVTAGLTLQIFAITRDAFDNFIGNPVTATWTITVTGGVTTTDITPTTGASTTFTARKVGTGVVQPSVSGLSSVPSGTLTVVAGTATKVRIESAANGSGTLIASQTITAGNTLTVFAIRRDAFDNFVNNPSATWTFTPTGGVLSSDLTPTTGASTTFTARKAGTGTFRANVTGPSLASPNVTLTVVPGDPVYLDITFGTLPGSTFSSPNAGGAQTLNIIAYDVADNVATTYTGTKTLVFSGALSSTNPVRSPTFTDQTGAQVNFGVNTLLTFVNGAMSTTSGAGNMRIFRSGSQAINVQDVNNVALDSAPNGTFTANVSAITPYRLAVTLPSTSLTAGVPVSLTVTAQDQYGNTNTAPSGGTSYTGNKALTFSSSPSITAPNGAQATVTPRHSLTAVNFGTSTLYSFALGVANTLAGQNGVMRIYKTGTFTINVTSSDSTPLLSNPGGDLGVGYLVVTVANSPNQSIDLRLGSPQVNGVPFVNTNQITITDQYQNLVAINAATRPVVLTTSLIGVIGLEGSGNDNTLDEADDFNLGTGRASLDLLGMTYTGTVGTGTFTATVASPLGGFLTDSATVTVNPGAPSKLTILGKTGNNAPVSDLAVAASTPVSLEIRAFDVGDNPTTNFTSSLSLIFSSGGNVATGSIRDSGNNTVTLGASTPINFVSGVSTVQPDSSNGRLVISSTGTYFITAAGGGATTALADALVLDVGVVSGSNRPDVEEPDVPEIEEPEVPAVEEPETPDIEESDKLFLPSLLGHHPTQAVENEAPEGVPEQESGKTYLPTAPK